MLRRAPQVLATVLKQGQQHAEQYEAEKAPENKMLQNLESFAENADPNRPAGIISRFDKLVILIELSCAVRILEKPPRSTDQSRSFRARPAKNSTRRT
jgi:hypothetical protein